MVSTFWILFDMVVSLTLLVVILVFTCLLLSKIKLKLKLATKMVFYFNTVSLCMRMLFTVWQYTYGTFQMTRGKQYFVFACESVCFCFYLYNATRVIASWMLIHNTSDLNAESEVHKINKRINLMVFGFFVISVPLVVLTAQAFTVYEKNQKIPKGLVVSILTLLSCFYLYQIAIACYFSWMV